MESKCLICSLAYKYIPKTVFQDNTYPGCSSDTAGHWYSLSSDLNPNWTSYYVLQPELLAYWKGLVKKHSLDDHLVLNTRVVSAVWNDTTQKYRLIIKDEKTGVEREEFVEAIISATGGLSKAAYPEDIADIEQFKGPMFHSTSWNHDVSLSGKRVGVVGNAASACVRGAFSLQAKSLLLSILL